jgi:NADPH-dependent curcumin reductase CurA
MGYSRRPPTPWSEHGSAHRLTRQHPRVSDWRHRRDEALRRFAEWQRAGKIRFKEDVLDGIGRMPKAFLLLLHGKNFGKQIVRIN